MGIAQLVLDAADPVNFAPNYERRLVRMGTGEEVRTRAVVMNTIGDMNVPFNTGAAIARAAGFIELFQPDPRWGKTPNRVLIDNFVLEATERMPRHLNSSGQSVLLDVDNLGQLGALGDGLDVPRLSPPMRLVGNPSVSGITGTLMRQIDATGRHGFPSPDPARTLDMGALARNIKRATSDHGEGSPARRLPLRLQLQVDSPLPAEE